jgi:hypothetical protein
MEMMMRRILFWLFPVLAMLCLPVTAQVAEVQILIRNEGGSTVADTTMSTTNEVLTKIDDWRNSKETSLSCAALPTYPYPDQYACDASGNLRQWNGSIWTDLGVWDGQPVLSFPTRDSLVHHVLREFLRRLVRERPTTAMQTEQGAENTAKSEYERLALEAVK